MEKGKIVMKICNWHDKKKTAGKTYLLIHPKCVHRFGVQLSEGLESERIARMKNKLDGVGCVFCGKTVRKNQIHIRLSNASDKIATKKVMWIHKNCASDFAKEIKMNLNSPRKS